MEAGRGVSGRDFGFVVWKRGGEGGRREAEDLPIESAIVAQERTDVRRLGVRGSECLGCRGEGTVIWHAHGRWR